MSHAHLGTCLLVTHAPNVVYPVTLPMHPVRTPGFDSRRVRQLVRAGRHRVPCTVHSNVLSGGAFPTIHDAAASGWISTKPTVASSLALLWSEERGTGWEARDRRDRDGGDIDGRDDRHPTGGLGVLNLRVTGRAARADVPALERAF